MFPIAPFIPFLTNLRAFTCKWGLDLKARLASVE